MAGPGFGDLRTAESSMDDKTKAARILELLPKLKDPQRRARAEAWLAERGIEAPRGITLSAPEGATSVGPAGNVQRPDPRAAVTLREAADRLAGSYDEQTIGRLRAGDLGALSGLRPSDQAEIERTLAMRRNADPVGHAPMADRPKDLPGELDARVSERAPVTRTRGGRPELEPTHTTAARATAALAQPAAGALRGLQSATGHLATLPARMIAPEGQAVLDELADSSAVSTPASIAANMLPMSLGSKMAGAAARLVPEVAAGGGMLRSGLRGLAGMGRATAAGGAAGAADATGVALNEMAQGAPVGESLARIPGAAVDAVPPALMMYPLAAGLQRLGARAVDDLRQSPDLGPEVLALERVGLSTRVPIFNRELSMRAIESEAPAPSVPGRMPFTRVRGPEPEGNTIAAAQREQQATGRPAATITGERAGKKVLGTLAEERDEMLGRHREENEMMSANLRNARVKTEPIAAHLMDLVAKGKFDDFSALPGKAGDNRALQRELESVVTVRWAQPGERGILPEAVAKLGFKVPPGGPAPRAPGDTIPPPGKRGRARQEAGLVIEPKELSADQLETSIRKFDELADEARNVKKGESGKAAQSIAAVMRSMRNSFRTDSGQHAAYVRSGPDARVDPETGEVTSSYARTKREHGQQLTSFEDKLKELGLAERVDEIRPEDANQLRAVVGKIMGGDPQLQELFPDNPAAQRELRIAAAHKAFDDLYGTSTAGKPNVVAGPSGTHGILTMGGSARLAFDPIARGLAGTGLPQAEQRALAGSRAGRVAPQIPPETVDKFLAMLGLGGTEEDM